MSAVDRPDRALKLYEGHVRWIMNRPSPEERLIAWETVVAIAFPRDDEPPYQPPQATEDGVPLSSEDIVRRDTYDIFHGLIKSQSKDGESRVKDSRKVAAGRLGAAKRYGKKLNGESDTESSDSDAAGESDATSPMAKEECRTPKAVLEDDFHSAYEAGATRTNRPLSAPDRSIVEEWDRKIPNAKALHAYIEKNFIMSSRTIALAPEFSEYAYQRLAIEARWISTKDNRPLKTINTALHWLAIDYKRQIGQMKRLETEERRKDLEVEYNLKVTEQSQMSSTELADMERKRRRKAEKEAMEKIVRGEL